MATNEFKGLSRLDAMQRRPVGTNSALSPANRDSRINSAAGAQYRRLTEDYNRAQRILTRQARRGDARSALEAIRLRQEANEAGFSPGGIRRREEFNAGLLGRLDAREQAARDMEQGQAANRTMVRETMAEGEPADDTAREPVQRPGLSALESAEQELFDASMSRGLGAGPASAEDVLGRDRVLDARRGLDAALGEASTEDEIAALRERGARFGVSGDAFDRRRKWWDRNRS